MSEIELLLLVNGLVLGIGFVGLIIMLIKHMKD
jgi:hypothetical protein